MDALLTGVLNCPNCSVTLCVTGKGLCIVHYHQWYVLANPNRRNVAQLFELLRRKLVDKAHYFANSSTTNTANQSQETKAISNDTQTHLHIYDKEGNEIKDITQQKGTCTWIVSHLSSRILWYILGREGRQTIRLTTLPDDADTENPTSSKRGTIQFTIV